ncbi:tail fiber assembly protein [Bordetella ansorpii]|uniref:Tail fiber assembly protein n=1 Tax=Bordetella ansorpii TaxID=288768 RepID=A0A157SVQ6_9BORD|nr:phage tail assembly chaperone [Bordetella ansorpii]SAI74552.1 tail fiber assembly protein [Bordetella ansorpii]
MEMVYQVDARGLLLHAWPCEGPRPGMCVQDEPPNLPEGQIARWDTSIPDYEPTFGNAGTGQWLVEADYRTVPLFVTSDGRPYDLAEEVDGQMYPGTGPLPEWLTAQPRPTENHRWDASTMAWVLDQAAELAAQARAVRARRDELLNATNGLVLRSVTTAVPLPQTVLDYLQALRDVPEQVGFPTSVTWPEKPAAVE